MELVHTVSHPNVIDLRSRMYIDYLLLITLFLASFYFVYFLPQGSSRIFFLLLLVLFLVSKRDYLWFAFFFVLAQGPGYLFADYSGVSLQRLPLYAPFAGMSFTPIDFFVFLALLKALIRGKKTKFTLGKPLLALLLYIIFSLFVASLIFGTDLDTVVWNIRWLFYYSIIVSFAYLVYKKRDMYAFIVLIIPCVFFVLFTQVYFIATGNEFINLFNPDFRWITVNSITGSLRPVMGGVLVLFSGFIFSILMSLNNDHDIPNFVLYLTIVAAFISVILSATRLWFVIFSFVLVGYIIVSKKKVVSTIGITAIFALVLGALIYLEVVPLEFLVESSWGRLRQVSNIATGNIYSIDTARSRILVQVPILIEMIRQNPIIGYGFSYVTMSFYNNNFGFLNTILLFGISGFALLLFFIARLLLELLSCAKKMSAHNPHKTQLKILVVVWLGILVGYFTTWDFFTMSFDKVFFTSILIVFVEFFAVRAKEGKCLGGRRYVI